MILLVFLQKWSYVCVLYTRYCLLWCMVALILGIFVINCTLLLCLFIYSFSFRSANTKIMALQFHISADSANAVLIKVSSKNHKEYPIHKLEAINRFHSFPSLLPSFLFRTSSRAPLSFYRLCFNPIHSSINFMKKRKIAMVIENRTDTKAKSHANINTNNTSDQIIWPESKRRFHVTHHTSKFIRIYSKLEFLTTTLVKWDTYTTKISIIH